MHKCGESKMTWIMLATVHHVTSGAARTKFQAAWFLLDRRQGDVKWTCICMIRQTVYSCGAWCHGGGTVLMMVMATTETCWNAVCVRNTHTHTRVCIHSCKHTHSLMRACTRAHTFTYTDTCQLLWICQLLLSGFPWCQTASGVLCMC